MNRSYRRLILQDAVPREQSSITLLSKLLTLMVTLLTFIYHNPVHLKSMNLFFFSSYSKLRLNTVSIYHHPADLESVIGQMQWNWSNKLKPVMFTYSPTLYSRLFTFIVCLKSRYFHAFARAPSLYEVANWRRSYISKQ